MASTVNTMSMNAAQIPVSTENALMVSIAMSVVAAPDILESTVRQRSMNV